MSSYSAVRTCGQSVCSKRGFRGERWEGGLCNTVTRNTYPHHALHVCHMCTCTCDLTTCLLVSTIYMIQLVSVKLRKRCRLRLLFNSTYSCSISASPEGPAHLHPSLLLCEAIVKLQLCRLQYEKRCNIPVRDRHQYVHAYIVRNMLMHSAIIARQDLWTKELGRRCTWEGALSNTCSHLGCVVSEASSHPVCTQSQWPHAGQPYQHCLSK